MRFFSYSFLLITADEGQIVNLVFEDLFQIEFSKDCEYDVLIIRDGRYGYSPPLRRICGDQKPEPINSTGRYMSLLFKTDDDINGFGFFANYTFINGKYNLPHKIKTQYVHCK